jgi:hypothetical protein
MELTVEIVAAGGTRPPAGSTVIVQVRDAGNQDVSATTLAETRAISRDEDVLGRVQLSCEIAGGEPIVWVHVDVDDSGEVSKDDYITMQSYPVRSGGTIRVEVRKV